MTIVNDKGHIPIYEKLAGFPHALEAFEYAVDNYETNYVPEPEELATAWGEIYDDSSTVLPLQDVYGVMRDNPGEKHWAVASIDLCEVTRETAETFMKLGGFTIAHAGETYGYGKPFGLEEDPESVTRIVQAIMSRDQVTPVPGIEDIQSILSEARQSGIYIIANTSTLPACEIPTLRWLKRYLPDCFDGIVLPRNHDGTGPVTKGTAKEAVVGVLNSRVDTAKVTHTLHIDDAPHHIRAVRDTSKKLGMLGHADFTPKYIWNTNHTDMNHQDTPHESFIAANDVINKWKLAN